MSLSPRRECDDVVGELALEPFGVSLHHWASSLDRRLSPICAFDSAEGVAERRLGEIAINAQPIAAGVAKHASPRVGGSASTPAFPGAVAKAS
jgi:hypothetical protein